MNKEALKQEIKKEIIKLIVNEDYTNSQDQNQPMSAVIDNTGKVVVGKKMSPSDLKNPTDATQIATAINPNKASQIASAITTNNIPQSPDPVSDVIARVQASGIQQEQYSSIVRVLARDLINEWYLNIYDQAITHYKEEFNGEQMRAMVYDNNSYYSLPFRSFYKQLEFGQVANLIATRLKQMGHLHSEDFKEVRDGLNDFLNEKANTLFVGKAHDNEVSIESKFYINSINNFKINCNCKIVYTTDGWMRSLDLHVKSKEKDKRITEKND